MEPTHKQKQADHEESANIRQPCVQECPKDLRRLVKAIDHQWAYTFFLCGFVTPASGPTIRLRTQEKAEFVAKLWHQPDGQSYCCSDTGKLQDFLIRVNALTLYIEAMPNDQFYKKNVHLATARNAFSSMIYFAVEPHVKYDPDKPFSQSAYEEDAQVKKKQRALYSIFGGSKRWERLCKTQRIFWPKAYPHPWLLSAEQLGMDKHSKKADVI